MSTTTVSNDMFAKYGVKPPAGGATQTAPKNTPPPPRMCETCGIEMYKHDVFKGALICPKAETPKTQAPESTPAQTNPEPMPEPTVPKNDEPGEDITEAASTTTPTEKFVDPLPNLPKAMKEVRQWVRWKLEKVNGKWTKVPYQVDGRHASSTDPNTWTDYRTAVTAGTIDNTQGVGFMFANGFAGIDLDGCRDPKTGDIKPWAQEIIDKIVGVGDVYVEISPSGTGLHVIVRAKVPGKDKKFNLNPAIGFGKAAIEVYDSERYFTVTGNPYFEEAGDVVEADLAEVYEIFHQIRRDNPLPTDAKEESADAGEGAKPNWLGTFTCSKYQIFSQGEIISREPSFVISNRIGEVTYESQSEADLAFCTVLAIKFDGDADKIDEEFRKSALYREKWERADYRNNTIAKSIESAKNHKQNPVVEAPAPAAPAQAQEAQAQADAAAEASKGAEGTFPGEFAKPTDAIPPFDESMLVGVIRKLADALCAGTTIPRQYGSHTAKAMLSAIMTKFKIKLEGCASTRSYFITFGETGTGKGEIFRRMLKILACWLEKRFVYITDTIDSEAGMRDAFFDIPEGEDNYPILYFVDEVLTLGQKADGKKNPEIIGGIVEMADKTTVSRAKSKRGKAQAMKTRQDSWLLLYACAQDGEAFATAFPRTKKQGFPDRFIPEYSGKVDAGNLPEPNIALGLEAISEAVNIAKAMKGMTMLPGVSRQVESIWNSQPDEFRKSPRLRQQLMLEMYLTAFARGSAVAEDQDLAVALKWFERQKPIRRAFFSEEIPDQVGVYIQRLRKVLEEMAKFLRKGKSLGEVAKSFPELATTVEAYKHNDLPIFKRAWDALIPFMVEIPVKAGNGHQYQKVVPMPEETDMWLPAEYQLIHPKSRL